MGLRRRKSSLKVGSSLNPEFTKSRFYCILMWVNKLIFCKTLSSWANLSLQQYSIKFSSRFGKVLQSSLRGDDFFWMFFCVYSQPCGDSSQVSGTNSLSINTEKCHGEFLRLIAHRRWSSEEKINVHDLWCNIYQNSELSEGLLKGTTWN